MRGGEGVLRRKMLFCFADGRMDGHTHTNAILLRLSSSHAPLGEAVMSAERRHQNVHPPLGVNISIYIIGRRVNECLRVGSERNTLAELRGASLATGCGIHTQSHTHTNKT